MPWNPTKGERCMLIATVLRYDPDPQPGVVDIELTDRHGTVHRACEKTVMFANYAELDFTVGQRREAHLDCAITEINGHHVTVETYSVYDDDDKPLKLDVDLDALHQITDDDD